MPVVEGRQYRSFSAENLSAKTDESDSYIVEGYATTFDDAYDMGWGWSEKIDRHALDGADLSDVIFQYDHSGMVMARNRNGSLAFLPDDHGLYVRADLGGTREGRDLHEAIKSGLVDRMSWAFMVDPEDGWEYDRDSKTSIVKRITKVYDVSAVSIPANDGTEIKARSYLDGVIEAERLEQSLRQKRRDTAMAAARLRLYRLE